MQIVVQVELMSCDWGFLRRGVGLCDRYDCGMYWEVVPLVRATNKLNRPFSCIFSYDSSLIVKSGVIVLV